MEMIPFVVLEMGPESGHQKQDTGCNHTVGHSFPVHFWDHLVGLESVPRVQPNIGPQVSHTRYIAILYAG